MKRADLGFAVALLPLDYLALASAAFAAYALRFTDVFVRQRPVVFDLSFSSYANVVLLGALFFLGVYAVSGLYQIRPRRIAIESTRILLATSTGFAALLAFAFFSRTLFESRFIMLAAWAFAVCFVVAERVAVRGLQRSLRHFGVGLMHVAVIGNSKSAKALIAYFAERKQSGYNVVLQSSSFASAKNKILSLKRSGRLDMVLVADPDLGRQEVEAIKGFTDVEHLTFAYSADLVPAGTARPIIHTLAGRPVIEVPKTPLDGWGAIYKRAFDIAVSLLLIIISLPLQILIAVAIFVENPGPIFFRRLADGKTANRVGQGGKEFPFLKFRTMVKDAHKLRFDPEFLKQYGNERGGSPLFKLQHDPRVTRVGAFLRKYSLDEIPQFYLVLMGYISLVGPRPHLPEEVALYKPEQRKVLTIKPGITGMAQINGRASLDFDDEVRLDLYYIENWSPWLDLVIILKTPLAVLFKKGAY